MIFTISTGAGFLPLTVSSYQWFMWTTVFAWCMKRIFRYWDQIRSILVLTAQQQNTTIIKLNMQGEQKRLKKQILLANHHCLVLSWTVGGYHHFFSSQDASSIHLEGKHHARRIPKTNGQLTMLVSKTDFCKIPSRVHCFWCLQSGWLRMFNKPESSPM